MFRVSRGIIEEVTEVSPTKSLREVPSTSGSLTTSSPSDSASSRSENPSTSSTGVPAHHRLPPLPKQVDNQAVDIQYFRRFHVILDTNVNRFRILLVGKVSPFTYDVNQ